MRTVPASTARDAPHELKFPFNLRPVLGFWKLIAFRPAEFEPDPARSAAWNRGRYLVEAAAHCSECHTSRDAMGVLQKGKAYAGAPNLEAGARFASNITPHRDGIGDWSEQDIADFLKSGQDKCFNEPEGMREVIASVSKLSDPDVSAIGVYIHALPPIGGNADHKTC
jgi:mono/diheme cytochrome c family protein